MNVELLVTQFVGWLPSLLGAIVIFLGFWLLFRLTEKPVRTVLGATGLDRALAGMLLSVYRLVVLVFGGIMALSQLGIDVGAALAGLGVVGLTIGFAAKDSLTNTIAGFLIFWDKPFSVDDWLTIGDQYGCVNEITMRTTRLRTLDNTYVIIPNQKVLDEVLVNHSKSGDTRVVAPVGIAYKESIDEAREVILGAVSSVRGVLADPAPSVVVAGLGASSVDLDVRVWVADAAQEKTVFSAVVEAAKKALDGAGIEIPFPHLQLFFDGLSDEVIDKTARKLPALVHGGGRSGASEVRT